jgi:hypothetical protein
VEVGQNWTELALWGRHESGEVPNVGKEWNWNAMERDRRTTLVGLWPASRMIRRPAGRRIVLLRRPAGRRGWEGITGGEGGGGGSRTQDSWARKFISRKNTYSVSQLSLIESCLPACLPRTRSGQAPPPPISSCSLCSAMSSSLYRWMLSLVGSYRLCRAANMLSSPVSDNAHKLSNSLIARADVHAHAAAMWPPNQPASSFS